MRDEQPTETTSKDDWMTAAELSREHKIAVKTIRQMARSGRIPAIRWGRAWRFRPEEVERALRAEFLAASQNND